MRAWWSPPRAARRARPPPAGWPNLVAAETTTAAAAGAAEQRLEEVAEVLAGHVAHAGRRAAAGRELEAAVPAGRRLEVLAGAAAARQLVVGGALLRVGEHGVGLVDLAHARGRVGLLADVRVVLAGELAVGLLHRLGVGALVDPEGLVVVLEVHVGPVQRQRRIYRARRRRVPGAASHPHGGVHASPCPRRRHGGGGRIVGLRRHPTPPPCKSPGRRPCGSSDTARAPATSPATMPRRTASTSSTSPTATSTCRCRSWASSSRWRSASGSAACRTTSSPTWCCARPTCAPATPPSCILRHGRLEAAACALRIDERLREKEFGILDRLTKHGIAPQVPRAERAARPRRQVLLPPARRRELVRRHPAPAQPAGDDHARVRRPSACSSSATR